MNLPGEVGCCPEEHQRSDEQSAMLKENSSLDGDPSERYHAGARGCRGGRQRAGGVEAKTSTTSALSADLENAGSPIPACCQDSCRTRLRVFIALCCVLAQSSTGRPAFRTLATRTYTSIVI